MSKQTLPSLLAITTGREDANLCEFIPFLLENVCSRDDLAGAYPWGPVPERPEVLQLLGGVTPYTRIMQKVGVREVCEDGKSRILRNERGEKVTEKSVKGFVWIDADPMAVLLNKYVNSSCHTLDNSYSTRTGNINYIYCPYAAGVFAGKFDPSNAEESVQPATSPITRRDLYFDADYTIRARVRKHQAVANAFIMRARNNDPYLVISRCYDSCAEVPWQKTIYQEFLLKRCQELGIGLVFGRDTNKPWENDITGKAERALNEPLYTPEYEFGGNGEPFTTTYYSDAGVSFVATSNGKLAATIQNGYVLLEPARKGGEDDYIPKLTPGLRYGMAVMETATYICAISGRSCERGEVERIPDGTCFSARAVTGVNQAITLAVDLCKDINLLTNAETAYDLLTALWSTVQREKPYADCMYELAGVDLTKEPLASYLRTSEGAATRFNTMKKRRLESLAAAANKAAAAVRLATDPAFVGAENIEPRKRTPRKRQSALVEAAAEVGAEAGR